jgi:hypothetical protein
MKKALDILGRTFMSLVCAWVIFALCFQVYMIYVHFTDEEKEQRIANEFDWKFDGRFKNYPGNIWYEGPKK